MAQTEPLKPNVFEKNNTKNVVYQQCRYVYRSFVGGQHRWICAGIRNCNAYVITDGDDNFITTTGTHKPLTRQLWDQTRLDTEFIINEVIHKMKNTLLSGRQSYRQIALEYPEKCAGIKSYQKTIKNKAKYARKQRGEKLPRNKAEFGDAITKAGYDRNIFGIKANQQKDSASLEQIAEWTKRDELIV